MQEFSIKDLVMPPEAVPVWVVKSQRRLRPQPPHTHDCMEIMFIRSGVASCRINNCRYPVVRGDFYVFTPGDIHAFSISGELTYDTLLFSMDIFTENERKFLADDPIFSKWSKPGNISEKKLNFYLDTIDKLEELFDELSAECQKQTPSNDMLRRAIFIRLLFYALEYGTSEYIGKHGKYMHLSLLLDYINRHCRENLTLEHLAKIANVSPHYLYEFMQRSIGQGVMEYLHHCRIEHVRQALEHSDMSVSEIAVEYGFYDASHLVRVFKKYTGVTPGKYRKFCSG